MPKFFLIFSLLFLSGKIFAESSPFRFHLQTEPTTLSVYAQKNASSLYFLGQINEALIEYYDGKISGRLAKKCSYVNPKRIKCEIKKNLKWSDGSDLTSEEILQSFQKFIDPKLKSYRADILFPVKNAKKILEGTLEPSKLGIKFEKQNLIIELEVPDSEFIYTLASPLLSPQHKDNTFDADTAKKFISSGPYKIKEWFAGKKIVLENNPFYFDQKYQRPPVEILFVNEDSVALNMYEKKDLTFLRRLPTLFIEKFKNRPDFLDLPLIRFDYIGFGPELKDHPKLREALSLSLEFPELQTLFSAKGLPGCPGIPESFFHQRPCLTANIEKAKAALAEDKKSNPKTPALELYFSKQGGEDHKRATEWMQAQWRSHLGLNVGLYQLENKIYVQKLESQTPSLFRRGVGPSRPTCLAALEVFAKDSPEDYLKITSPVFQAFLEQMKSTLSESKKKMLCEKATQYLLKNYLLIPLGPIHFSLLVRPEFKGWRLNELNQLDLSRLEYKGF